MLTLLAAVGFPAQAASLLDWLTPYLTTILATVAVLGVLIFVHELGHFLLAKIFKVRVEVFSLGFPPKLISKKIGDTDYRLSVVPLGGYVKLLGENPNDEVPPEDLPYSFLHRPLWQRGFIILAGPVFNFLFAIVALFLVFAISGIPYQTTDIGQVEVNSPAARGGLRSGDLILKVDGTPIRRWEELAANIRLHGSQRRGQPLVLSVKRGSEILEVKPMPEERESKDRFGKKKTYYQIGVASAEKLAWEQVGPFQALEEGLAAPLRFAALILQQIYQLVAREISTDTLGGPIMIAQVAGKQAEQGLSHLIIFMAVLSVNLTLLNLLPIPVLDGGHLLFLFLEAVLGRPLPVRHREMAQAVGMMLLLGLMLLVFYHDIMRLVSPPPQ